MKNLILTMPALMGLALAGASDRTRFANAMGEGGSGVSLYTGEGDPSISIDGNVKNFSQEGHIGKEFTFTIDNAATASRTARLFAGYNTGDNAALAGQLVDGAFTDVNGNPGLSGTSADPDTSIRQFQRYVERNPTRVVHVRIQTTVASQLQQAIKIHKLNPFNQQGSTTIKPALVVGGNQFNDKIADVAVDIQLDDLSDITTNLVAGSSTTYTFFCGATLSSSQELAVKANTAKTNLMLG